MFGLKLEDWMRLVRRLDCTPGVLRLYTVAGLVVFWALKVRVADALLTLLRFAEAKVEFWLPLCDQMPVGEDWACEREI